MATNIERKPKPKKMRWDCAPRQDKQERRNRKQRRNFKLAMATVEVE